MWRIFIGRRRASWFRSVAKSLVDTRVARRRGAICKRATGQGTINHEENRWRSRRGRRVGRWRSVSMTPADGVRRAYARKMSIGGGSFSLLSIPRTRTHVGKCVDMQIRRPTMRSLRWKWVALDGSEGREAATPSRIGIKRYSSILGSVFVTWSSKRRKISIIYFIKRKRVSHIEAYFLVRGSGGSPWFHIPCPASLFPRDHLHI